MDEEHHPVRIEPRRLPDINTQCQCVNVRKMKTKQADRQVRDKEVSCDLTKAK